MNYMSDFAQAISGKLSIRKQQVEVVLALLEEGSTIPFIARYRKDKTGALDEVQIQQIQDEAKFLKEFTERKEFIEKTISGLGRMTDSIQEKLNQAFTLAELEDIYLPFKPKRKSRALTAKENGLEPLADLLLKQSNADPLTEAGKFLNDKIADAEAALQGARDIIAELVNEDAVVRARLRKFFEAEATIQCKIIPGKEVGGIKYKDYFDFSEPISRIPSHRILAILRGFLEGALRMAIAPPEEAAIALAEEPYVKGMGPCSEQVRKAAKDAYRRLLQPSLETEFRTALKAKADEDAIDVFAENLKQLLLSSPLGSKRILAIDPGYRTGCKLVCLDEKGGLQHTDLIYPHEQNRREGEAIKVRRLLEKYAIETIAIGDGTAGRETEQFIKSLQPGLPVFMVNEDGASIYSASEIGREEFPDQDITVRGAVSIGRRLMDPLSELVKLEPKSIGVGQYQHDVNQFRLKERLDATVISCVNSVGVNLNTAGKYLLAYVSGIGGTLAENITRYRNEIGRFSNRRQLLNVPRLGAKAYEQCAGFLRISNGDDPLDQSAVHPESYPVVQAMAKDMGVEVKQLIGSEGLLKSINPKKYVTGEIGELTVTDILKELKKPGLDPRPEATAFEFANIYSIDDLQVGMEVPGIVTNITRFGAFVDIGVKQDGLVHISEISHSYITDPGEVLKLNQKLSVKVMEVDAGRKRITLSIKQTTEAPKRRQDATGGRRPPHQHMHKKNTESISPQASMTNALDALRNKFNK
jgi:uncharacterized protein